MTFVRLEGSFGRWGQKYIEDKFRRCNLATKGGADLLDGQSYLTSWEKVRRDGKKKEVAKKLGEILVGWGLSSVLVIWTGSCVYVLF